MNVLGFAAGFTEAQNGLASLVSLPMRRFPAPWTVEKIAGGLVVRDANGQSLAYLYTRENPNDAHMAKVLTEDEAWRNGP